MLQHGYSNSRTCEIGLSLHSGVSFKSIVYLVDKVSTSKKEIFDMTLFASQGSNITIGLPIICLYYQGSTVTKVHQVSN